MQKNLKKLEEYRDDNFVIKSVYKGEQSEAILLLLMPGQVMPQHAHKEFEVVLLPLKGSGVLIVDLLRRVDLVPETLYYEEAGKTFEIENTGTVPLQVLVTLIRIGDPATLMETILSTDITRG